MAFQIPGDVPDLQSLHLRTLDNSIGTLTTCAWGSFATITCATFASDFLGSRKCSGAPR